MGKNKDLLEIDVQIMNDMLDDIDYEPMQRNTTYTDYEVDSVRALWVLEHQLRYDEKIVDVELKVKNFIKKYDIKIPIKLVTEIVSFDSPYRKTPAKRESIRKLLKEARRVENNSLFRLYGISNDQLVFKNHHEKSVHLAKLLRVYMRKVGGSFRLNKTVDGRKIELAFPETKRDSYKGKKIIKRIRLFDNENDALFFLAGFVHGHSMATLIETQKWEKQVLNELQKRNN